MAVFTQAQLAANGVLPITMQDRLALPSPVAGLDETEVQGIPVSIVEGKTYRFALYWKGVYVSEVVAHRSPQGAIKWEHM